MNSWRDRLSGNSKSQGVLHKDDQPGRREQPEDPAAGGPGGWGGAAGRRCSDGDEGHAAVRAPECQPAPVPGAV